MNLTEEMKNNESQCLQPQKRRSRLCVLLGLFSSFFVLVYISAAINQDYQISYLMDVPGQNALGAINETIMILVVTFWNSGGTWFGELIAQSPNSFFVYEPLHILKAVEITKHKPDIPDAFKEKFIEDLFHCQFPTDFLEHANHWPVYFPNQICNKKRCDLNDITRDCISANYRAMKTVRFNLDGVEEMLMRPSYKNLKVIYLVRDPRAVMNSLMKRNWPKPTLELCPRLRANVESFANLKFSFPDRIFFLRYEDIAQNPFDKAKEVWRFIHNSSSQDIPAKWRYFLNWSKRKKKILKEFPKSNLRAKSIKEWQSWRKEISSMVFENVQKDCSDVMEVMGYKTFNTFQDIQNYDHKTLLDISCVFGPCE